MGDEYVLISHAVWERAAGNWYVPADFLDKVLPSLLDGRLIRRAEESYEIEAVDQNQVSVRVFDYPDHLSVVFQGSRPADAQVREYHDYLSVTFDDVLVKPGALVTPADHDVVRSIEFVSQDALGAFRIRKGTRFGHFLEHHLDDPPRLILDIYGVPAAVASTAGPSVIPAPDRPVSGAVTDRRQPTPSVPDAALPGGGGVVIDPGHGGVDYGVDISSEVVEKVLALELSQLVDERLHDVSESTHLTRNRDVDLDLERRSALANFYHAGAFITIHAGGAPTNGMRGPVVYVYDPPAEEAADSRPSPRRRPAADAPDLVPWNLAQLPFLDESHRLAEILQKDLNGVFDTRNKVCAAPVAVLAPVQAPAVLIEVGFLTNPQDLELLAKPEFRAQVASSIARSLSAFLRSR